MVTCAINWKVSEEEPAISESRFGSRCINDAGWMRQQGDYRIRDKSLVESASDRLD